MAMGGLQKWVKREDVVNSRFLKDIGSKMTFCHVVIRESGHCWALW
jgi:hypothetical protein